MIGVLVLVLTQHTYLPLNIKIYQEYWRLWCLNGQFKTCGTLWDLSFAFETKTVVTMN